MMKNLKRVLALTLLLVAVGGAVLPNVALVQFATAIAEEGEGIASRADIIDWRYTTIDGRIHRRLWNYSRGFWIGEWEPL